ncbi:UMP kinase [Notoacmeibacter marinus]|uniref:Uridylate kinase n=1 Tax=Notoacmeibacter marinus TaxID=1876515 RepID=A0A231UWJ7_9HYPH|nr:UMP kinase [Notoacmeibacter marinus]OXT00191.1 UMP kinase [Notoacmeibacter marinus]
MADAPQYKRILLKASGEALMGDRAFGIDQKICDRLAADVRTVWEKGVSVGIVIGGGNIFRGVQIADTGGDRVTGDHMGMLATVMNALALRTALRQAGVDCVVLSALAMDEICDSFTQRSAMAHLSEGRVVIFAAGTGNPFFTTDTAAALRAAEIGADVLLKATQVDGIYAADPQKNPDAERFDTISHEDMLARGLRVMDTAAVAVARDSQIPIIVYSLLQEGGLAAVLSGEGRHTLVPAH